MTVKNNIIIHSLGRANQIFEESANLKHAGADAYALHENRNEYLQELVGETGHMSFHPIVEKDLTKDFKEHVRVGRDKHYHNYLSRSGREETIAYRAYRVAEKLYQNMTNEHLIDNTIPTLVGMSILDFSINEDDVLYGFKSPKLSKLLVKLFGESSDIVKWFSNKCPKKLDIGLNKEYKVHLSILPHHVAGMSYFGSYNWGGNRWETGYKGTTCMDTINNSKGENIYALPPALMDSTLAVAYLSFSHNDDEDSPIMESRSLVRVVELDSGDYVLIGLRPFYTSNETRDILWEGLKNQFHNFVDIETLRDAWRKDRRDTKISVDCPVTWTAVTREVCGDCEGDGEDEDGYECNACDGAGHTDTDLADHEPYIDDSEVLSFSDDYVHFSLPTVWLEEKGYIEKEVSPTTDYIHSA